MKQDNNPLVSIVLLSYNGERYIKPCLNSVFSQGYPHLEVLVIDNASNDGTVKYLKNLSHRKNFKVIFSHKNLGFAAGHNLGISKSHGEFVLCLNQDAVLASDFISNAVDLLRKDKNIAAVQGKLLRWNTGGKLRDFAPPKLKDSYVAYIVDTKGLSVLKNRRIVNNGQSEIDSQKPEKPREIFGVDGAAPIYRKKALEDVRISLGGKGEYFDEDFFMYKEDVDLAWRLRLYGWKAIYQPKSVGWHDRTAGESAATSYLDIIRERRKISKFAKYLAFKNQRLMQVKNEQIGLLIKHFLQFFPKELISWLYVICCERYTWKAIKDLFKQAPNAWRKRKLIMARKRVSSREMEAWFK